MNIQYNIMIADIDKLNHNLEKMNILQLKWILYNLIQKNNYKVILNIKINIHKIQYNIMIFGIDKNNNNFKLMNILQLKWILYNKILKKYCNKVLNNRIKINLIIILIMEIFINL